MKTHSRKPLYAVLFLAIWLLFESTVSFSAFCNYGVDQPENRMYTCAVRGPLLSSLRALHQWWAHVFDDAESYIALFTAVLFVATALLWWSTRMLWLATNDTLRHAESTAARQLRAYLSLATTK